ncbi:MAG: hypothetical protein AB3N17_00120, partial [Tateyamaria sp.]
MATRKSSDEGPQKDPKADTPDEPVSEDRATSEADQNADAGGEPEIKEDGSDPEAVDLDVEDVTSGE